ncbi:apolipoprotein A-II [Enoplosus armatus]|uniref:apolipoprotein A-II n=1 Tax=Enoplosus armatus TaxID=215367 RepID=UPI0039955877
MNAKYALALILALQVSMSMCETLPSAELVEKYDQMKAVFYQRLLNAYGKLQAAVGPYVEQASESQRGQLTKDYIEDLQTKPEFQAFVKIATGVAQEGGPLVDTLRTSALGLYEERFRPHIGEVLDKVITHIKAFLDVYLPTQ